MSFWTNEPKINPEIPTPLFCQNVKTSFLFVISTITMFENLIKSWKQRETASNLCQEKTKTKNSHDSENKDLFIMLNDKRPITINLAVYVGLNKSAISHLKYIYAYSTRSLIQFYILFYHYLPSHGPRRFKTRCKAPYYTSASIMKRAVGDTFSTGISLSQSQRII